ncbi:MAG: NAD+ synthase [Methanosarcinales archaeon]|nr:NAD+ synthase [Methanosarcinales archaeon]
MSDFDPEKTCKKITHFIRSYSKQSGTKGAVIGMSGGIDSTLTTYLTVKALGRENVLGVIMPEKSSTTAHDILDATEVGDILRIEYSVVEIANILDSFLYSIPEVLDSEIVATGNLKARIRMCILYYYANIMKCMVVGTSNRTELLLGYFTKFGDGGVDIEPMGNLYKTQVRKMADYLKVPKHIIDKPPSAGLWAGQTDENELGLSYEQIDNVFSELLDKNASKEYVINRYGIEVEVINSLIKRIENNRHKSKMAPIPPE